MQQGNWPIPVRTLHWLTVLLMILCIGAVWGHEAFDKTNPLRAQLMQTHFLLGGIIGLTTILRLLIRSRVKTPVHPMTPLVAWMAKAGHLGLYLLMLGLPVCGYIAVSGRGLPINLLGLITLPPLPVSQELSKVFRELHEVLGNGIIALVAIHFAAALFHAIVLKDKILQSMTGHATT